MFFPVFTQRILSVKTSEDPPRILEPASFIPLAFFFWNAGDLTGRLLTALPALRITSKPRSVLILSVARILWVPLYYLCNIDGKGAIINSDFFYLVIVQFMFGLSNGFLGSTCMMGAVEYVEPEEREATGGFMGLMLVGGLAVGSLLSFLVA
jgi:equilibrative nucleoside transporter 1/2/3